MFDRIRDLLGRRRGNGGLGSAAPGLAAGDIVSVKADDGGFGVVKLLAVDDRGVHVRLYVQRFAGRPTAGELGQLSLAPPGDGVPFSIGHVPLSFGSFAAWRPERIKKQPVSEDELDGYRMWKDAQGGYF